MTEVNVYLYAGAGRDKALVGLVDKNEQATAG